jgi:ACT domain-containing protein
MNQLLPDYIQNTLDDELQKKLRIKESMRRSRKKYIDNNCSHLQVNIDKETVFKFKQCVKERGHKQAVIIKKLILSYIAGSDAYGSG